MTKQLEEKFKKTFVKWAKILEVDNVTISRDNRLRVLALVQRKRKKFQLKYNMKGIKNECQILGIVLHELFHVRGYNKFQITDGEKQEYFAERSMLFILKRINQRCYKQMLNDDKAFLANTDNEIYYPDHYRAITRAVNRQ